MSTIQGHPRQSGPILYLITLSHFPMVLNAMAKKSNSYPILYPVCIIIPYHGISLVGMLSPDRSCSLAIRGWAQFLSNQKYQNM